MKNGCFEEIFADTAKILEKWRSERANKVTPPWVHRALTEFACACPDTKLSSSADKLGLNPTRLKKLRVTGDPEVLARWAEVQKQAAEFQTPQETRANPEPETPPLHSENTIDNGQSPMEKPSTKRPKIVRDENPKNERSLSPVTFTEYVPVFASECGTQYDTNLSTSPTSRPELEIRLASGTEIKVNTLSPPLLELLREALATDAQRGQP